MLRDLLHPLAALALGVVCLLVMAGTARADDAQVSVFSPGGEERTLSLAALAGSEDVVERTYVLRAAEGESEQTVTGFSLAAILEAAGADPYGFSYLEVQRPAGGSVLLSRHQALDPGAFADGSPVVYATATGTGFLRPSSGEGDVNATDSFESPQGVALVLRKDSPLLVEAKASTVRTRPGQPVEFTALVERAGAGEQLIYSWYFDDGHSASSARARHSFAKRGSYDVVVGVTTPGNSAGASAVVNIQVGPPLSGPDRKGGGRSRDADAPDHGAAAGTRGAVPPGPAASGGSAAGITPPDTRPAAALSVRRSNTGGALREAAEGERVAGRLVSATTSVDAVDSVAARRGELDDGEGGGLPDAALGLLVSAGLFGAGVLVESRGVLR
jgi:PKD domain